MTSSPRPAKSASHKSSELLLAIAVLCCVAPLAAQTPVFTSFDAPHAGRNAYRGTFPTCINQLGVIAGYYYDSLTQAHGFVRSSDGVLTEFDPTNLKMNLVTGINSRGEIVGEGAHLVGGVAIVIGFLRKPNGNFIAITLPGSVDTRLLGINDNGQIAGEYLDAAAVLHGFLRDASGTYTVFDEPNSSGTGVSAINANGDITGFYADAAGLAHGYIRDQFGNFTSFDPSGAMYTNPQAINLSGEVTGAYTDANSVTRGFARDANGVITSFESSGSLSTFAEGMNDSGAIVGVLSENYSTYRGFERDPSGAMASFSVVPPATFGVAINNVAQITGYYVDSAHVYRGFVSSTNFVSSKK